jgi:hypothetical protein
MTSRKSKVKVAKAAKALIVALEKDEQEWRETLERQITYLDCEALDYMTQVDHLLQQLDPDDDPLEYIDGQAAEIEQLANNIIADTETWAESFKALVSARIEAGTWVRKKEAASPAGKV